MCTIAMHQNGATESWLRINYVVEPPQIYAPLRGIAKNIYQNISAKNAHLIIPPCDFARGNPRAARQTHVFRAIQRKCISMSN
jgi:hypothetical protein